MNAKKTTLENAAITSAVMALLLSAAGNAAAARPTSPDACQHIAPWERQEAYPPEVCVEFEKRVWSNDRFAHPGQKPGMDHPLYHVGRFGPMAKLWHDIGDYVPPSGRPDVVVEVGSGGIPSPIVHAVPTSEKTSVYFTSRAEFASGRPRPAREGEFTLLDVMAEDASNPGMLMPVRLRAQRNTTGTGYDGTRVQMNGTGGPAGPGALVVWYEPSDNPRLNAGTRYVTPLKHRAIVQAIGGDMPDRPVLKSFSIGVDIVHRDIKAEQVRFDGKQARFVLPLATDQGRSGWYATTTSMPISGPAHGTGHCPKDGAEMFMVPVADENNKAFSLFVRAYKTANLEGTGAHTTAACRIAGTGNGESLVFELRPEDNRVLRDPSIGTKIRNALPYHIAVRNAAGSMADQAYTVLNIDIDMTVEKDAAPTPPGPKDPKDPKDPSDPKHPGDPKDPADPKDPGDPKHPGDPKDPGDPQDPADPEDPADPVDPDDPADPADPADPVDPAPPDDTPRVEIPAPKAGQLGGTYQQGSIYKRNYLIRDVVKTGTARKLTYLNYSQANLHRGDDGLYRCQSGGATNGWSDPFADYGKQFTAAQSVDGKADSGDKHALRGNFNQLLKLKKAHPIKTLISIGGAGRSGQFAQAASTAAGRNALAESCVDVYIKGNLAASSSSTGGKGLAKGVFDGINLQWLAPRMQDVDNGTADAVNWDNYLELVKAFRDALQREGSDYLLTASMNAAEDLPTGKTATAIAAELNWVNVQAYDLTGPWNGSTGHASGVSVTGTSPWAKASGMSHRSLMGLIWTTWEAGIPQNKQVYGIPFHGQGWTSVKPGRSRGLWMAGQPVGSSQAQSVRDYRDIKRASGFRSFVDVKAQAAWRYDGWTFWSYDNRNVVKDKIDVLRRTATAGVFASNLAGDDNGELINVMEAVKR